MIGTIGFTAHCAGVLPGVDALSQVGGGIPPGFAAVTYNGEVVTYNGEPIWVAI